MPGNWSSTCARPRSGPGGPCDTASDLRTEFTSRLRYDDASGRTPISSQLGCSRFRQRLWETRMKAISRRVVMTGMVAAGASVWAGRAIAQAPSGPFKLDPLPYPADKNEPHIDAQTMTIHHDRHHAAYVANLNTAAGQISGTRHPSRCRSVLAKLGDVPEAVRTAVRNNGGGHANHTMFWQIMGGSGGVPDGDLKAAVDRDLGGLEKIAGAVQRRRSARLRLGLGVRHRDANGKLALIDEAQPGYAADGRTARADGQRCLGARLLPEIPEPPRRTT